METMVKLLSMLQVWIVIMANAVSEEKLFDMVAVFNEVANITNCLPITVDYAESGYVVSTCCDPQMSGTVEEVILWMEAEMRYMLGADRPVTVIPDDSLALKA